MSHNQRPHTAMVYPARKDLTTGPQNYEAFRKLQAELNEEGPKVVRWIHIRYYPPGLILDYSNTRTKRTNVKLLDLLDLTYKSDITSVVNRLITSTEGLLNDYHREHLEKCVHKLKQKMKATRKHFKLHKSYKCHSLPILCAGLSRQGKRFATGSFDKACKVWNLETETDEITLNGHADGVASLAFDVSGKRILTGSYDRTTRCWKLNNVSTKWECQHILQGPTAEVQVVQFNQDSQLCAVGSADNVARVYDLISGLTMYSLTGHGEAVTHVQFDISSNALLTGSADATLVLWDLRTGDQCINFVGHEEEISACSFNYQSDLIASSSWDTTVRVWDIRSSKNACAVLDDNADRVNDVKWNSIGARVASGAADGAVVVWDFKTGQALCNFVAHQDAVNNVNFSSNGALLLTNSDDSSIALWKAETGESIQKLNGHQDRVLYSTFDYLSDTILSVSKDNVCNIWKNEH